MLTIKLIKNFMFYVLLVSCEYVFGQKIWHSNYLDTSRRNRDEITMKNVSIDVNFSLNFSANFWRSIDIRNGTYAVGIGEDKMVTLKFTKNKIFHNLSVETRLRALNSTYLDATLYEIYNEEIKKNEVILVAISSDGILDWFSIERSDLFWTWNVGYQVRRMKIYFNNVLRKNQIFIASDNSLNVYHFEANQRKIWLAEKKNFRSPISSFDVASFRSQFYMLVTQTSPGELHVLRYLDGRFQPLKNISAADIEQVVAFQDNFKTFFAIDGLDAGIYKFGKRSNIFKERIINSHSEGVKYWLPVSIKNIKQNLILFAQRILEHGSHKSLVTEIFTYNNENFEEHEDIPCQMFGEHFNNLHCLGNDENLVGIKDAAVISVGDRLGLLLAKRYQQSLFNVEFEVRTPENPVDREMRMLNDTKNRLQELLNKKLKSQKSEVTTGSPVSEETVESSVSQNNRTLFSENQMNDPVVGDPIKKNLSHKLDEILVDLEAMKTKMARIVQYEKAGKFKRLVIDGSCNIRNVVVEEATTETIRSEPAEEILEDIVRKNQEKIVGGTKTFSDLDVTNLHFETVNGNKASDMLFRNTETLNINGDLTFEKPVSVLRNIEANWINDEPSSGIVDMKKPLAGTLSFENIDVDELQTGEINKLPISETWFHSNKTENPSNLNEYDTIFIPHNLTVKRVNGDDFENLKRELCLVNIETRLPGRVTINGDVTVEEPSTTKFLNRVNFPQNYFFVDGIAGIKISGSKLFQNTLRGGEVRTNDQYVNGVKTADYFTLSTPQEIKGRAIFNNLEITGKFEHDGKTIGDQISKFLPNPTMLETKAIKSNVNFEELEVTGSIIVEENLNNMKFKEILEDVVYNDEESPTINSIKEFPEGLTVRKDLTITSNSINLIPLDQIVTKNSNQILNIAQLNGNVSIETMEINQLINGINVTKLDQETVKIVGEQFISSLLVFKQDLEANNLEIMEKLNDVPVENFYVLTGDRIINHDVVFDEMQAENILVSGNVEGNIAEINLENFVKNRMTYSTKQNIPTDFTVKNSVMMNMKCNEIGTVDCKDILDVEHLLEEVLGKIASGQMGVKNLSVNEGLSIERMDGILLTELQDFEENSITIRGNVHFPNLQISKLSDVDFQIFLENVVFKNETNIQLTDGKLFKNGFSVNKLIETNQLNSVPIENLLRKQGSQTILAPIEIVGNVTFKSNVTILETMNDISMADVKSYFEMNDDIYVIKGDIMFDRFSHIHNLEIMGNLNNEDVQNLINNIAYSTNNLSFSEEVEFLEKVTIDGKLDVRNNVNDMDLSSLNDNIVHLDKAEENNVGSLVAFTGLHTLAHNLVIETDLVTKWMNGIDLEHWKRDCVYINKGLLPGTYKFENVTIHDILSTKFVNNICMNRTISLRTDQGISELTFKNVVFLNDVSVGGLVNGLDLKKEYSNTVLSNEEQEIMSGMNFYNNILIRNNLEIAGLLNDQSISKIVTTAANQNLSALYNFSTKTNLESSLHVNGLINSINMSLWENGTIKMISKEPQEIEAPWHVGGNLTFDEPLDGENVIYNFEIDKKVDLMQHLMMKKIEMEQQYKKDQENICKDIRYLSQKLKKQIYRFETFEEIQILKYPVHISKTYFFLKNQPVLLINGVRSCKSDLFVFKNEQFVWITDVQLGEIDQILSVPDKEVIHFVVKSVSNPNCEVEGTNVWEYKNFTVQKIQNIDDQQLLQESLVPSTFYAMNKYGVTEFKIDIKRAVVVFPYRKWKMREDNMAFVPRGLKSGLAVRTGQKLIKLLRDDPIVDNEIEFGEVFLIGGLKTYDNYILPGRNNSKLTVINVGPKSMRRSLLAIVFREDTIVEKNLDSIKIYESYSNDKLYQKIPTYNPTALLPLEMENGETLLLILENEEKLQIYQYTGNEGFKRRSSADISGTDMFKVRLDANNPFPEAIGIVGQNKISIIKPVMLGNTMNVEFEC